MEISKEQIKEIEKFAKSKLHSVHLQHTLESRDVAKKLARLEKADWAIVEVAVLLHDIAKGKKLHAEVGAEMARKFLTTKQYDQRFIEEVVYCILVHEDLDDDQKNLVRTKEAIVVYDSEKIQKISAFGIIKYICGHNDNFKDNYEQTTLKMYQSLKRKYDRIISKQGKEMASDGFKFIKGYFKE